VPLDVDPTDALTEEQALDPIDVCRSLADQTVAFTMGAAQVLLLGARFHHHGADMALTAAPGDQRVQQLLDIDTVGLHPTGPQLEEARQPEAIVACLIAEDHLWHLT
jgi:hypothetical protein